MDAYFDGSWVSNFCWVDIWVDTCDGIFANGYVKWVSAAPPVS